MGSYSSLTVHSSDPGTGPGGGAAGPLTHLLPKPRLSCGADKSFPALPPPPI